MHQWSYKDGNVIVSCRAASGGSREDTQEICRPCPSKCDWSTGTVHMWYSLCGVARNLSRGSKCGEGGLGMEVPQRGPGVEPPEADEFTTKMF